MVKTNSGMGVDAYIATLRQEDKALILEISDLVLAISSAVAIQIKWNSVSFYYTGEIKEFDPKTYKRDILVCNFHRGQLLLVFPTGAKIVDQLDGKNYPDGRKIVTIKDFLDFKNKEKQLVQIVIDWLSLVEKPLKS